MKSSKLVLASASPRRRELLAQIGYQFEIVQPDVEEIRSAAESPAQYVERLSREKALAGAALVAAADTLVIGADTIVVKDHQVLEKPRDFADAQRMLRLLSGSQHQVLTAVSVTQGGITHSVVVTTDVWFKTLSEPEIQAYWQSGEPCDKAGSYGIQGLGGRFVTRIEGNYYAVVGLPLYETDQLLHKF
ncbi:MAG: Maf family protein [Vibrio sp.]